MPAVQLGLLFSQVQQWSIATQASSGLLKASPDRYISSYSLVLRLALLARWECNAVVAVLLFGH